MTDAPTPPPRRLLDPAAIPLFAGGAVLVAAAGWLWLTPRPVAPAHPSVAALAALEVRLGVLEPRLAGVEQRRPPDLTVIETRIATLEARPPVDIAPTQARIAALEARPPVDLAPIEARIAALPPPPDLTPLAERLEAVAAQVAAVEARAAEALARPVLDPQAYAPRAAAEGLATRAERLSERLDAIAARQQAADAEGIRRVEDLARSLAERLAAADRAEGERLAAAGAALEQRVTGAESALVARIVALEAAQARIAALEARAARIAALDALRQRLDAGQALGPALAAFPTAPPVLVRFTEAAPPTEPALRLSFEESARAARAASEASRDGQGVLDSAVTRLSGLVTVRRGQEVVWGDAAAAEIERARRALDAGDLEGALARLARLPAPAQEAMRHWAEQARALSAARAALTALGNG